VGGSMMVSQDLRKSKTVLLKPYCPFADENSFLEACKWTNDEGYDINVCSKSKNVSIQLTHGEIEALLVAVFTKVD